MVQPGMPVIPIPFTLMPWPIDSQINMGFDYERSRKQQEIRQERIDKILNLGKPKEQISSSMLMNNNQNQNLYNSRLSQFGQYQLNSMNSQYQNYQGYQQPFSSYPLAYNQLPQLGNQQNDNQKNQEKIKKSKPIEIDDNKLKKQFEKDYKKVKHRRKSNVQQNPIMLLPPDKQKKILFMSSRRFRIFKACIIFISYYIKTLNAEIKKKVEVCRDRDVMIPEILENLAAIFESALENDLLAILNNQVDFRFENTKSKINRSKVESISTLIIKILTTVTNIKPVRLNGDFFMFLKSICIPGQFPPLSYFIQYEIKRIKFTAIGQIGKIEESTQFMIIEGLLIIRILVYQLIFKAWEYHPDQDNQGILLFVNRNSLILGSILIHIYIDRYQNEEIKKFLWKSVKWNRIRIIPQITDENEELDSPSEDRPFVKNMLPFETIQPYITYMKQDSNQYSKIIQLLNEIVTSYHQELVKYIQENKPLVVEKQRMITLIMNTMFREVYVARRQQRQSQI